MKFRQCMDVPCTQTPAAGRRRCYFHQKVADGLIAPLEEYLSEVEVNATMDGRLHQDGRRLDHFVTEEF